MNTLSWVLFCDVSVHMAYDKGAVHIKPLCIHLLCLVIFPSMAPSPFIPRLKKSCHVSVAWSWQLASRRRLLPLACQPADSEVVEKESMSGIKFGSLKMAAAHNLPAGSTLTSHRSGWQRGAFGYSGKWWFLGAETQAFRTSGLLHAS